MVWYNEERIQKGMYKTLKTNYKFLTSVYFRVAKIKQRWLKISVFCVNSTHADGGPLSMCLLMVEMVN
jgi:hypothetical protein